MRNGSNETWREGDLLTWHGAEVFLIPTLIVTGVVGNSLVLYVYTFRLRTSTVTIIKRMLAALDLTSLLLAQPVLLYTIFHPHSDVFQEACIAASYLVSSMAMSSECVLVMIAVDRFMRLCLLSTRGVGGKLATKVFVCSIFFSTLANIPCIWIFGKEIHHYTLYNITIIHCSFTEEAAHTVLFRGYFVCIVLFLLLSLTAILFLYIRIIKTLRVHTRVRAQLSVSNVGGKVLSLEKSLTKMCSEVMQTSINVFIAITVLSFLTSLLYLVVVSVCLLNLHKNDHMTPYMQAAFDVAKFSRMISSAANPIIYSYTSSVFRQEVQLMRSCKRRPKKEPSPVVSSVKEFTTTFSGTRT